MLRSRLALTSLLVASIVGACSSYDEEEASRPAPTGDAGGGGGDATGGDASSDVAAPTGSFAVACGAQTCTQDQACCVTPPAQISPASYACIPKGTACSNGAGRLQCDDEVDCAALGTPGAVCCGSVVPRAQPDAARSRDLHGGVELRGADGRLPHVRSPAHRSMSERSPVRADEPEQHAPRHHAVLRMPQVQQLNQARSPCSVGRSPRRAFANARVLWCSIAIAAASCGDSDGSSSGNPSNPSVDGGSSGSSGEASIDAGSNEGECVGTTSALAYEPGTGDARFVVGTSGAFLCRHVPATADAASRIEIRARSATAAAGAWALEHSLEGAGCAIATGPNGEVAVTVTSDDGVVVLRRNGGAWTEQALADVADRSNPIELAFSADGTLRFVTATNPSFGQDRLLFGAPLPDGGIDWSEVDTTTNSFGVLDNLRFVLTPAGDPEIVYRHSPREGDEETLKHAARGLDGGFAAEILPLNGRDDGRRTSIALGPAGETHVSAYFEGTLDEAIVHFARASGESWTSSDAQRHPKTAGKLLGPTSIGVDTRGRVNVIYANEKEGGVVVATRAGATWTKTPIAPLPKNAAGFLGELVAAQLGPDDRIHVLLAEPVPDGVERARLSHVVACPLP